MKDLIGMVVVAMLFCIVLFGAIDFIDAQFRVEQGTIQDESTALVRPLLKKNTPAWDESSGLTRIKVASGLGDSSAIYERWRSNGAIIHAYVDSIRVIAVSGFVDGGERHMTETDTLIFNNASRAEDVRLWEISIPDPATHFYLKFEPYGTQDTAFVDSSFIVRRNE